MIITKNLLQKILRFAITGGLGMVVDFGVTIVAKEKLRFDPYIAHILGTAIAIIFIFFMHRNWTFTRSGKSSYKQFPQFLLVSVIGLLLNFCILFILQTELHISFYLSKTLAIGLVSIWNFSINSIFTFAHQAGVPAGNNAPLHTSIPLK